VPLAAHAADDEAAHQVDHWYDAHRVAAHWIA
jgi:hypothetical protein